MGSTSQIIWILATHPMVYHINISSVEGTVRASGIPVGDVRWHMVDVLRSGLAVSLTIDSNSTFQHTLADNALILNIDASQIYAGGRPVNDDVSNGYTGCLQDIRLDQFVLPTSGSNDFASVTFGGSSGIIRYAVHFTFYRAVARSRRHSRDRN